MRETQCGHVVDTTYPEAPRVGRCGVSTLWPRCGHKRQAGAGDWVGVVSTLWTRCGHTTSSVKRSGGIRCVHVVDTLWTHFGPVSVRSTAINKEGVAKCIESRATLQHGKRDSQPLQSNGGEKRKTYSPFLSIYMRKTVLIVLITFGGRESVLRILLIRVDRVDHLSSSRVHSGRSPVDVDRRSDYPEGPPVVVRGLLEVRVNDGESVDKKRGKPGPKPKLLNPAILSRLCDAIRTGATIELACKYAGIAPSVYFDAQNRAKNGDPEWQGVAAELADAEGACAVEMLSTVTNAARNGTWPAAAWMLERRYPMMYGRSESRFVQQAEPVEPYQTREELIKALASIPADVLSDALAARKQSA